MLVVLVDGGGWVVFLVVGVLFYLLYGVCSSCLRALLLFFTFEKSGNILIAGLVLYRSTKPVSAVGFLVIVASFSTNFSPPAFTP